MIRAVIFDFDGLILDTETPGFELYCEVFRERGVELSLHVWERVIGGSGHFNVWSYLEELCGETLDHEVCRAQFSARFHPMLEGMGPLPGVEAVIEEAKRLGLRLGVASSSEMSWVGGHLERLGLKHHFEAFATREDVARTKPDPALFLLCCERLGVAPREAIVFEDSANGIRAAKAAGCFAVAVPNAVTRGHDISAADLITTRLDERTLDDLVALASSVARASRPCL